MCVYIYICVMQLSRDGARDPKQRENHLHLIYIPYITMSLSLI